MKFAIEQKDLSKHISIAQREFRLDPHYKY